MLSIVFNVGVLLCYGGKLNCLVIRIFNAGCYYSIYSQLLIIFSFFLEVYFLCLRCLVSFLYSVKIKPNKTDCVFIVFSFSCMLLLSVVLGVVYTTVLGCFV